MFSLPPQQKASLYIRVVLKTHLLEYYYIQATQIYVYCVSYLRNGHSNIQLDPMERRYN